MRTPVHENREAPCNRGDCPAHPKLLEAQLLSAGKLNGKMIETEVELRRFRAWCTASQKMVGDHTAELWRAWDLGRARPNTGISA